MDADTSVAILWRAETILMRPGRRLGFRNGLGARFQVYGRRAGSRIDIYGVLCGLCDNGFLSGVMDLPLAEASLIVIGE